VDVEDADDAEEDVTGPPPAVDGSWPMPAELPAIAIAPEEGSVTVAKLTVDAVTVLSCWLAVNVTAVADDPLFCLFLA
jgi:hypothetical protein